MNAAIPEDLVDDLYLNERRDFGAGLTELTGGRQATRNDVIALRIAGDPDIFNADVPLVAAFKVVRQLVAYGLLNEESICRRHIGGAA